MQVTVFGASGKVGRIVVSLLIESGYTVVAFVHKSNPFEDMPDVKTVEGSITDVKSVNKAVTGSGAVICTLGSWGSPNKDIVSSGTKSIIEAMNNLQIKRLITLTGSSAFYSLDKPNFKDKLTRNFFGLVAPMILRDGEQHLRLLEASTVDWTCLRSPAMTASSSYKYHLSNKLPTLLGTVPRRAVAKCLVDQLELMDHIGRAPVIYRA